MNKYSQEQVHWLIANGPNYTINELLKMLQTKFNLKISYNALYNLLHIHYVQPKSQHRNRTLKGKYTEQQIQWIKDNIDNYYYPDMVKEFNKKFNSNITYNKLIYIVTRNNIIKTKLFQSTAPSTKYIFKEHIECLQSYAPTHYIE